jgi:predicted RND superfamily exporter protein
VVVQTDSPNPQLIQNVIDDLAVRLERSPEHFTDILYRIDQRRIRRKGLQYLTTRELKTASRRVDWFAPVIQNSQWEKLSLRQFAMELRAAITSAEEKGRSPESLYRHAHGLSKSLKFFLTHYQNDPQYTGTPFESPWPQLVSVDVEANADDSDVAYLLNAHRNIGRLHVSPVAKDSELNNYETSIAELRQHIDQLTGEYGRLAPDLKISLTGIPVLEHDELVRSRTDMLYAALISFFAVGLLLSFGFRSLQHPMLLLLTIVVSLAFTFALATLAIGHLNILSICFAAILIGLGVDFGIHFMSRYLHLRQELYEVPEALELAAESVGAGILTSAFTTALAFGSAALTGFPGLAELGIIASGGILFCAFTTFTFLPALIALSDAEAEVEELPTLFVGKVFRSVVAGFPLIVIGVSLAGVGGVASRAFEFRQGSLAPLVTYDSNILKLQDDELESVQAERLLSESANESLLYAVAIAGSQDEAVALRQQFMALPSVRYVSELASQIPPPPSPEDRQLIHSLVGKVRGIPDSQFSLSVTNPAPTEAELHRLLQVLNNSSDPTAHQAAVSLEEFLTYLASLRQQPKTQAALLDAYQMLMATSLLKEFNEVSLSADLSPVNHNDLPASWRQRYLRVNDTRELWLLKIYPSKEIWADAPLKEFVTDLRTVKADVTGIPVQNFESAVQLGKSYKAISLYSLAIIALFLLMDFLRPGQKLLTLVPPMIVVALIGYTMQQRTGTYNLDLLVWIYLGMAGFVAAVLDVRNLRDTLLALTPPLVGSLVMLGIMAMLQIDLNPLNLIVLPLILGIGVDDGIHMVTDYRRQIADGKTEYVPSADTLTGVLLTSLTSVVGFGSLMISQHRGLQSVGELMAIGVGSCMLIALVLLPAVLTLVAKHQPASMEPVRLSRRSAGTDGEDDESSDKSGSQQKQKQNSGNQQRKAA